MFNVVNLLTKCEYWNNTEHSWHFGHSFTADEYSIIISTKIQQQQHMHSGSVVLSWWQETSNLWISLHYTCDGERSCALSQSKNEKRLSYIFYTHCSILLVCCSYDMHMDCIRVRFKQLCTSFNGGLFVLYTVWLELSLFPVLSQLRDWETVFALSAIHLNNAAATKIMKKAATTLWYFFFRIRCGAEPNCNVLLIAFQRWEKVIATKNTRWWWWRLLLFLSCYFFVKEKGNNDVYSLSLPLFLSLSLSRSLPSSFKCLTFLFF